MRADLLVLLTVVDGMLDEAGQPVRLVENLSAARQLVRVEKSALGKGGMNSKLEAAAAVTGAGEAMLIAHGRMENVLVRILDHEPVDTLFVPSPWEKNSRSRWIGSVSPRGTLVIDDGAARAIAENNKSLLPAGIVRVEGTFDPGDCVAITRPDGTPIARGLCNYGSKVIEQIRGKKSREIKSLLGEAAYEEAIHRDNLVVG